MPVTHRVRGEPQSPVCPQNRAYGSVHGSSRKTDQQTNLCSSANRSLPFTSLSLQKPFYDHWPLIHPTFTSRALLGSLRADLRLLVSNEFPRPLTCSTLHLRLPCHCPGVLSSPASPQVHRHRALRLLRLRLQAPVPSRITSPHRLGLKVS